MRRTNKHNASSVTFGDFTGGVNVAVYGEQIAENEMQVCENFIYERDSLKLTGRGGLSAPLFAFDAKIVGLYHDADSNVRFVFLEDRTVWSIEGGSKKKIGKLTGNKKPVCCKFQNKLWIASGGKLQYSDYTDIYTVTTSYDCNIVFERFGRLAITQVGQDNIYYSAVGDGTSWEDDTNDDSTGKWLEVGYGDSGDIVAVVPLSTDLMIVKNNGNIYQLAGDRDWNGWVVSRIATGASPVGENCATNIGNDVIYLTTSGAKMLSTTMDYGNIQSQTIGDKFNRLLTKNQYEPRMCHLPKRRMILIQPTSDKRYIVAYNYGLSAATVLRFSVEVADVVESSDEDVYLAAGNKLYLWSDEYTTDNGTAIQYRMKMKDIIGSNQLLVKSIDTLFNSENAGTATVKVNKVTVDAPTNSRRKVRCNHSSLRLETEVESVYRFQPAHVVLEVADL